MKNSLKLVALVLCLVMALCSFVACDNEKAENTTPAETKQEETKDIA